LVILHTTSEVSLGQNSWTPVAVVWEGQPLTHSLDHPLAPSPVIECLPNSFLKFIQMWPAWFCSSVSMHVPLATCTCINYADLNNSMLCMRGHISTGFLHCDVLFLQILMLLLV